jgi:hypothetical protein
MAGQVNPITTFSSQPGVYAHGEPRYDLPYSKDGEVPVAFLDMRNPEFESRYQSWLDLCLLYEAGNMLKARAERILKKRPREDEEVYAARLDRFTYQNILGPALSWYGAALFENPPEIFFDKKKKDAKKAKAAANGSASSPQDNAGDEFYSKFLENCDGLGTNFVDFFKRLFQFMLTYGSAWVLADLRALDPDEPAPVTLLEEKERGFQDPHLAAYTPLNVINWREDNRGQLKWAVVKTQVEEQEFLQKRQLVTTWYYYDQEEFRVYQDIRSPEEQVKVATDDSGRKAKLINSGRHALADKKRLPLRRLVLSEGLWLANRAYLLLVDHVNADNTLSWALFMSNLSMPVIIGDVDASNMTNSEQGFLQFPAGTTYTWTEPAGNSFNISAKRIETLREECFRSMNLQAQGRSMHATPAMQSGRSKQLEMAPAKQILAGMGDDILRHMEAVLTDVIDIHKDEDVEPDVRGMTFAEDMSTEEVFAVTSLLGLRIPSKKFEKYIYKKVAKAWMVDANRQELVDVYREIDAGPTQDERDEEDFKQRAQAARAGLKLGLSGSGGPKPQLPPGQGGHGPKPKSEEGQGQLN